MGRSRQVACLAQGGLDPVHGGAPVHGAAQIDADAFELGHAGQPFLDADAAVVGHGDKRDGLLAGLIDVAALRHAGHDDGPVAGMLAALVDMAQGPIVETGGMQVGGAGGGIEIVAGCTGKARVHDADIDRTGIGRAVFGQQAIGRLGLGKAHAVDGDIEPAGGVQHDLGLLAEDLDALGQHQFLGDFGQGIVIAADLVDGDARLAQPRQLGGEKARRLHRGLFAIIEIAGDDQRIDLFLEAEIDNGDERLAGGIPDQRREVGIAQRQRAQRRIKVDIGSMNEAKGHAGRWPAPAAKTSPPGRQSGQKSEWWS